jgi:hypothetical protein
MICLGLDLGKRGWGWVLGLGAEGGDTIRLLCSGGGTVYRRYDSVDAAGRGEEGRRYGIYTTGFILWGDGFSWLGS